MKVSFEVLKWEEHNPRKDIKQMPWFRLKSDIGFSETLHGLSIDVKWLWVFILSLCAKRMSGRVEIELDYIAYHSGVTPGRVLEIFEILESRDLLILYPNGLPIVPQQESNEPVQNPNESVRVDKVDETIADTNGPKRREEKIREEEIIKDKKRQEEISSEACSSSIIAFFSDPIFKDTDIGIMIGWQNKYDESYLLEELPKAKAWRAKKQPKKNFAELFSGWLEKGYEDFLRAQTSKKKNSSKQRAKEIFESALSLGRSNSSDLYELLTEGEEDALRSFGVSRFFEIQDTEFDRRRIVSEFAKCI